MSECIYEFSHDFMNGVSGIVRFRVVGWRGKMFFRGVIVFCSNVNSLGMSIGRDNVYSHVDNLYKEFFFSEIMNILTVLPTIHCE